MLSVSAFAFGQDTFNTNLPISKKEHKKQDNFIKEHIIGKWKDQNSTIFFYPKNTYSILYDEGSKESGYWEIKKSKIILTISPSYFEQSYKILFFSKTTMKYQLTDIKQDQTIWAATKIAKFSN